MRIINIQHSVLNIVFLSTMILGFNIFSYSQKISQMPIGYPFENTLEYEWSQKQVIESKRLANTENLNQWEHKGYGTLTVSDERFFQGEASLCLESPTKGNHSTLEKGSAGRPWGVCSAFLRIPEEDWSDWNRISYWIYPDLPGFKVVSISMVFHNDGEEKVPDIYDRNGLNYQVLENQKWNKVYWEFEHLGREKVTGIEIRYRLQGNEPGATEIAKYFIDEIFIEKVEPDHYEGWSVAPEHIAYNHVGYVQNMQKTALSSNLQAKSFSLINLLSNETVIEKPIISKKTSIGTFQVMDFSEVNQIGTYILKAGNKETKPFRIDTFDDIYRSSIIKTINHFYTQRCGDDIPGIHSVCHRDWTGVYGDQTIIINGGWHDAGDLSQGLGNTTVATHAMFMLADKLKKTDPGLSARLIEEGKWGLDWILKTRFDDGARFRFSTMDFWTDGIIGTLDDVPSKASISLENLYCAKTEAVAAMVLQNEDPILASYALRTAKKDWAVSMENLRRLSPDLAGAVINSSLELYKATSEEKYKSTAIAYGDSIIACQQQENLAKDISLKGFFYTNAKKENIQHFSHKSSEQESVVALVQLCEFFPNHLNKPKWENAIRLYANYYKEISKFTEPYFMIPAGIYDLTKARDEVEKEQIKSGFKLNDQFYLKMFPTWTSFRGNSGTILSQAKGLASIATYFEDFELLELSYKSLDWHLGLNPFNQSLMYGEGYRYAGQYSVTSGNLVGGLPVGVQTHFNRDEPYWPAENCYNWKEIWVFPSARWLWLMTDFHR
jgi:hypothetical protein